LLDIDYPRSRFGPVSSMPLNDSLSVIVPVCNAEATLARHVEHLLDMLPDLSSRFEIVVVDDGSSDHTVELAADLVRAYPQLRLIRHTQSQGRAAAIETGWRQARGKTVLVQEESVASPTKTKDVAAPMLLRRDHNRRDFSHQALPPARRDSHARDSVLHDAP
jgi:hypothetical protein